MNQRATKNATKKMTWALVLLASAGFLPARLQAQAPDQATGKPLSTDVMDAAIRAREALPKPCNQQPRL
jgi:hypothetical protein